MGTIANVAAAAQAAAGTGSGTSSNNGLASLSTNFNTFLTLLTTQLKNQDPTQPVDSTQFTQQLVEFAGVQAQSQTNSLLQQLVNNSGANLVSSASSFVGTTVQASGNQGALINGAATFGYTLNGAASAANVTITDSSGNTVFSGTGPVANGSNNVTWNGQNSFTGAQEPDGTYTITVNATDANGNKVTATPFITGTVTSASIASGQVMLNIGSLQVPESNVTTITNLPGVPQQASSTSSTTSGS